MKTRHYPHSFEITEILFCFALEMDRWLASQQLFFEEHPPSLNDFRVQLRRIALRSQTQ